MHSHTVWGGWSSCLTVWYSLPFLWECAPLCQCARISSTIIGRHSGCTVNSSISFSYVLLWLSIFPRGCYFHTASSASCSTNMVNKLSYYYEQSDWSVTAWKWVDCAVKQSLDSLLCKVFQYDRCVHQCSWNTDHTATHTPIHNLYISYSTCARP